MTQPTDPQYNSYGQNPPAQAGAQYAAAPVGGKSKMTAALLAFFLGGIGVHNFYLGEKTKGLIHIALAVLGVILMVAGGASAVSDANAGGSGAGGSGLAMFGYFLLFANGIWAFVEFIMLLVKNDRDFAAKYNG